MKLTIDFETRSRVDLRKIGAWRYAEDPTTEPICLALKPHGEPALLWVRPEYEKVADAAQIQTVTWDYAEAMVREAEEIHAHNAHFEIAIWNLCPNMEPRTALAAEKVFCTMAQAAMCSLPLKLEDAGKALGLPIEKNAAGHRLMLQMCKPRKNGEWWETPKKLEGLFRYCIRDVEAEECLANALPPLPEAERIVWLYDFAINSRGVCVDQNGCEAILGLLAQNKIVGKARLAELTNGHVTSATQVSRLLEWLHNRGVRVSDCTKASIAAALSQDLPADVSEVLRLRQSLGKTSNAKFDAMLRRSSFDGRIRGTTQYHAAGTGRWGGRGVQTQNLPRSSHKDIEPVLATIPHGVEPFRMLWGDPAIEASKCVRGCLTAGPGKELHGADYSSIEGRGNAWVAGEAWVLDAYRAYDRGEGPELYCIAAGQIYGREIDKARDEEERQIGKVAELALGYQGWVGAFHNMAGNYGLQVPDERAKEIILAWRENRQMITALWRGLEDAAVNAVRNPGTLAVYRGCTFEHSGRFLRLRIPSGRILYYPDPEIFTNKWGRPAVSYMSVDQYTRQWVRTGGYGGLWTNNVVQGLSRDIEAAAIVRCEKAGLPVVLHTHDEVVVEVDEGTDPALLKAAMLKVPRWAEGLPLATSVWVGKRYRKD